MQFDTTLNVFQVDVNVNADSGRFEILLVTGTILPVNGGAMPVPIGVYRIPFPSRKSVQDFSDQINHALDDMTEEQVPAPSRIEVATNVNAVNHMAEQLKRFTK